MSFYIYDITFLAVFVAILVVFFFLKRKNFKWEGILLLYRTRIGVELIDRIAKKYNKQLNWMRYVVTTFGILLMAAGTILIFQLAYYFIKFPEIVKVVKIPPLMPLIPYLPNIFNTTYLPPFYFTYWIIAIACIAIFHEAAHGIFARYAKIKVKSTGFGFLGPFLAAFVEPDEKSMQKKDSFNQMSILAAGSFSNLILAIIFFLLLVGFFFMMFSQAGVMFNTYSYSYINTSYIETINGKNISDFDFNQNATMFNITVGGGMYHFATTNISALKVTPIIRAYDDAPAYNAKLTGVIVKIDENKITNYNSLRDALGKYSPGNDVIIETYDENKKELKKYNLTLGTSMLDSSKAIIGIGLEEAEAKGFLRKFYKWVGSFKEFGIYYEPKFAGDFAWFIYNLLWWLALINISVALFNMLPLGIFDGGRFFYLGIFEITKNKKIAEKSFKFVTYLFLLVFILLMAFWFIGYF